MHVDLDCFYCEAAGWLLRRCRAGPCVRAPAAAPAPLQAALPSMQRHAHARLPSRPAPPRRPGRAAAAVHPARHALRGAAVVRAPPARACTPPPPRARRQQRPPPPPSTPAPPTPHPPAPDRNGLIAVNYAARAAGVTRHMRVPDARKACPGLRLVHVQTIGGAGASDGADGAAAAAQRGSTKVRRATAAPACWPAPWAAGVAPRHAMQFAPHHQPFPRTTLPTHPVAGVPAALPSRFR
jgi:hypothetical protein